MRRRDKPLDIYKKLEIVRSVDELIVDEDSSIERSKHFDTDFFKAPALNKKKLNIPVCDVQNDSEYSTFISDDFVLPQNYVRHAKKIGDEEDVTIDYNADERDLEWLERHPKLQNDPELRKHLTPDTLEKIFNTLEKNTGTGDPLDMTAAERIVSQVLLWKPHISSRIFADVYQYWLYRRSLLHKPLCRRFWPQTANTDTDPHHVFRPREKERYRLRKHRKNDLASFRKLQSLRRDFGRARVLMQLVLERELLKQAQLRVAEEVFQQRLFNMSEQGQLSEPRCQEPFRHRLRFDHLALRENAPAVASVPEADDSSGALECAEPTGLKLTFKLKGAQTVVGVGDGKGDGKSDSKGDGNPAGRKKKSDGSRSRKRDRAAMAQTSQDVPPPEEEAAAPDKAPTVKVATTSATAAPSVPLNTRAGLPQSPWPSFMDQLDTRENLRVPRSMSEYVNELELRPSDEVGDSGYSVPHRVRYRGRVGRGGRIVMDRLPVYRARSRPHGDGSGEPSSVSSSFWCMDDEAGQSSSDSLRYIYPTHIASAQAQRYHVHSAEISGSFMVPENGVDSSGSTPHATRSFTQQLPTSSPFDSPHLHPRRDDWRSLLAFAAQLSPAQQTMLFGLPPTGPGAVTSGAPARGIGLGCAGAELSRCPLLAPPERDALASLVTPEEVDIYRMSDSEDEVVEVPRRTNPRVPVPAAQLAINGRQIVDRGAVKYSLRA